MTDAKKLIADALAETTRQREAMEDAMNLAAVPGSTVYVLHDGRRGWMHGESGTVVWANDEWAEVMFKDRGALRFRLKRLSRRPEGQDCWHGQMALALYEMRTNLGG